MVEDIRCSDCVDCITYKCTIFLGLMQKKPPNLLGGFLVARLGFEPRQTESESVVLPLHNRAVYTVFVNSFYIITIHY